MKYFLIGEKIFKSINFPPTYNLSEVLEATPENLAKLNLIPKNERKPFAVGEEVAVYDNFNGLNGAFGEIINKIDLPEEKKIQVRFKHQHLKERWFHPQQIRRLKPKPKAVRVTREQLAKLWDDSSTIPAEECPNFDRHCKDLGL